MANFIKVPDEIIISKKLSVNEKILMSVLLYYDRLVKWGKYKDIHPNQATLAEQCNMSVKSVNRAIKSLKDKRYIKTTQKVNRLSLIYELNSKKVRTESPMPTSESPTPRTESPNGTDLESQGLGLKVPLDNTRKDYKKLDIKKKKKEKEVRRPDIPYGEILNDLNTKCGKKFLDSTDAHVVGINNAWDYTLKHPDYKDDPIAAFFTVHDAAARDCRNNPEQAKWARPSTLYRVGRFNNNFENYLNQLKEVKKDYGRL